MIQLIKLIMKRGRFFIAFSLYALSALCASSAFSYENTTDIRRAIVTQNADNLTATDSSGRPLEEGFNTIQAPAFGIPANGLRNAVDNYIDERVATVGLNLQVILANLNMDSALYTHQQAITFDGENYDINYSILVKESGDYIVLERSLVPENPTFLAAYYLSGEGNPETENYNRVYVYQGDVTNDKTNPLDDSDLIYIYTVTSYHSPAALAGAIAAVDVEVQHKDTHICPIFTMPADYVTDDVATFGTYDENRGNLNVRTYCDPAPNTERVLDWFYDGNADNIILNYNGINNNAIQNTVDLNRVQGIIYGVIDDVTAANTVLAPLANLLTSEVCSGFDPDNDALRGIQTNWQYTVNGRRAAISYYFIDINRQEILPNGLPAMKLLNKSRIQQSPDLLDNLVNFNQIIINFSSVDQNAVDPDNLPDINNNVIFPIVDIDTIVQGATVAGTPLTPAEVEAQFNIIVDVPDIETQPTHHRYTNLAHNFQFASLCDPDDPGNDSICWNDAEHRVQISVQAELCVLGISNYQPPALTTANSESYTTPVDWHDVKMVARIQGEIGNSLYIEDKGDTDGDGDVNIEITDGVFDYYATDNSAGGGTYEAVIKRKVDNLLGIDVEHAAVRVQLLESYNNHDRRDENNKYISYQLGFIQIIATYTKLENEYDADEQLCQNSAVGATPVNGDWAIIGPQIIAHSLGINSCDVSAAFHNIHIEILPVDIRSRFLSEDERQGDCYEKYPNDVESHHLVDGFIAECH